MPALDVSFVLADLIFQDTFTVLRTPVLGSGQPDTANQQTLTISGVVLPGAFQRASLEDDTSFDSRTITIHTPTMLYDVMQGFVPDIVTYHGNQFKVMRAWDYSAYGTGFYAFECERTDLETAV
jgi:hypothetical protein